MLAFKNIAIYHKLAVFLLPPGNKLVVFNENVKLLIKIECKTLMLSYIKMVQAHLVSLTHISPHTRKPQLFTPFLHQPQVFNEEDNVNNKPLLNMLN